MNNGLRQKEIQKYPSRIPIPEDRRPEIEERN
jgi:hypothetical protein